MLDQSENVIGCVGGDGVSEQLAMIRLLTLYRLANERLQPLGHLSINGLRKVTNTRI